MLEDVCMEPGAHPLVDPVHEDTILETYTHMVRTHMRGTATASILAHNFRAPRNQCQGYQSDGNPKRWVFGNGEIMHLYAWTTKGVVY